MRDGVSSVSFTLESQVLQPLTVHLLSDLDKRFRSVKEGGREEARDGRRDGRRERGRDGWREGGRKGEKGGEGGSEGGSLQCFLHTGESGTAATHRTPVERSGQEVSIGKGGRERGSEGWKQGMKEGWKVGLKEGERK